MRGMAVRRFALGLFFALMAGLTVAFWNPMDHIKADFHADAHGLKLSLEVAAHALEKSRLTEVLRQ